MHNVAVTW